MEAIKGFFFFFFFGHQFLGSMRGLANVLELQGASHESMMAKLCIEVFPIFFLINNLIVKIIRNEELNSNYPHKEV